VIAAGGIADGRGIAAALALGAAGVQMGTAFLLCPETAVPDVYRSRLRAASAEDTRMTIAYSGRPARALLNRYMEEMGPVTEIPEFPIPYSLTRALDLAAAKAGSPDFVAMWAGQAATLAREEPAADLVRRLVEETRRVLGELKTQ
jgi:nitronate monooxygenase